MTPRARLAGVSVVVVRPAEQAGPLVAALEAEGAEAVLVPLVRVVDVDDELGRIAAELHGLGDRDWVVVTSPNGADRVAPHLAACRARVAAVGAATAARLPRVDLVPRVQRAEGLLAELPPAGGHGDDTPITAVIVQSADAAPTLAEGLTSRGWHVVRIDAHRTVPVVPTARDQLHALRADALLLTAGSQARAWAGAFGPTTPPVVVALGPQTARDAADAGLKVDVVAADHSVTGSIEALVKHLGR